MLYSLLHKKLLEIAPPDNGLAKDLYGIQFGQEINDINLHKIILCLDPTKNVINEAKKLKSHFIISHHGITHRSMLYFSDAIIDQIKLLSMNNISLFVMHTAWDAAPGGISETYAKLAGFEIIDNYYIMDNGKKKPIGRVGVPYNGTVEIWQIIETLKRNLHINYVQLCGNTKNLVKKAIIIGGGGIDSNDYVNIKKIGCDTIISGEFQYKDFLMARKLRLNLVATSHYKSEKFGMENLQKILSLEFPRDEFHFIESEDPVLII